LERDADQPNWSRIGREIFIADSRSGSLDDGRQHIVYIEPPAHRECHRNCVGTRAVEKAESIVEMKEWMGHANVQTTMRYLHYKSKADAARHLSEAFAEETTPKEPQPAT
jgi:integrase